MTVSSRKPAVTVNRWNIYQMVDKSASESPRDDEAGTFADAAIS
jgi:hypothetical protein